MVKFFQAPAHVYEHPWAEVTRAHFVKYPNPHARHVTAGDVLERRVVYVGDHDADRGIRDHSQAPRATDSDDQRRSARNDEVSAEEASPSSAESSVPVHAVLESTRIFVKRGKVPRWGQAFLKHTTDALVVEHSTVDPHTQTMTVHTRNLTHRTILAVEEHQTYRPHPERPQTATTVTTEARIVSSLGAGSYWSMGLAGRVESWGVHRFAKNALRSREGMQWVLDRRASASSETPTATGILRRPFWSASVAEADHHRVDHHHHVVDDGLRPG